MIRILVYIVLIGAAAFGLAWFADQPGGISIVWGGQRFEMQPVVGLAILAAATLALMIAWSLLRFVLRIPTLASLAMRMRKRDKGYQALSQGMIAAGAGDVAAAQRAARTAEKSLGAEPLALLLKAQAAQIAGDGATAEATFRRMADLPATRLFGLRGLYAEARRRGDDEAAHAIAEQAHEQAALPWAGQAMIERRAMGDDWAGALAVVERNFARKTIDRRTADRQRAVLKTAIGMAAQDRSPEEALQMAREAIKLAPDLTPAYALAGRMLARKGDIRRAAKVIEAGWRMMPHPDLAAAALDLRPGDSSADRLARAKTLARFAPDHRESRLAVARAALDARDFALARTTLGPLFDGPTRPSAGVCLLMAELEETELGSAGHAREWLARAARAPRDPAWIADGVISDTWSPASPVTGQIDAFRWETPAERLAAPDAAALDALFARVDEPAPDAVLIEQSPIAASPVEPEAQTSVTPEPVIEAAPVVDPPLEEPVVANPKPVPPSLFVSAPDDPGPDPYSAPPKRKHWLS